MKKQILTIISLILTIGMILPTANAEETSTYSDYVVEGTIDLCGFIRSNERI